MSKVEHGAANSKGVGRNDVGDVQLSTKFTFGRMDYKNFGYKIQKSALSINQKNDLDIYDNLLSSCPDINNLFINKSFDLKREKIQFVKNFFLKII